MRKAYRVPNKKIRVRPRHNKAEGIFHHVVSRLLRTVCARTGFIFIARRSKNRSFAPPQRCVAIMSHGFNFPLFSSTPPISGKARKMSVGHGTHYAPRIPRKRDEREHAHTGFTCTGICDKPARGEIMRKFTNKLSTTRQIVVFCKRREEL